MTRIRSFVYEHWLFLCILAIGLVLRFLFIGYQGLSNDELSGWIRTRPATWNSFWWLGVTHGDMHPVLYQAFLWVWVRIFGESELALRATGLLFYVLNSLLLYRICAKHFTKDTAHLILALFAGLSFMVINTSFARPYNSGTFFLLLSFWSVLELAKQSKIIGKWTILLAIGFLGAMLSHYAAFITAGVIGLMSIIRYGDKVRWSIVIAGFLAIIGFLPHLGVTLYQLNRGGLGWLGPPAWNWLPLFFYEFMNRSGWHLLLLLLIVLVVWLKRRNIPRNIAAGLSFQIFVFAYLVTHILSLTVTPILRDTVMLYHFPFLFLFLFNNAQLKSGRERMAVLISVCLIGANSVTHMKLLRPVNFPVFREVAAEMSIYRKKYGQQNITWLIGSSNVEYLNYYTKYRFRETLSNWDQPDLMDSVAKRVRQSKTPYFAYAWTNVRHYPLADEIIRRKYPVLIRRSTWFHSATSLYGKGELGNRKKKYITNCAVNNFPTVHSGTEEFVGEMRVNVGILRGASYKYDRPYFLLENKAILPDSSSVYFISVLLRDGKEIELKDGDFLGYQGTNLNTVADPEKIQQNSFHVFELSDDFLDSDEIKIYCYNPGKQLFTITKPNLYVIDPNR